MTQSLGRFGEAWAVGHLTRLGYRILDRNVRYRCGEIDIVARDGADLVFIEVKCRRSSRFGSPESSITRSRFQRLAQAIDTYIQERAVETPQYRVDVVAIEVGASGDVTRGEVLKGVEAPLA
ncbi:MAG: hypothetical protein NVS2B16_17340 [Chloroflexota bacterium]